MGNSRDRLKRLLDGNVEASDIAEDASLVSLADRLYGIKIADVKPKKARDMPISNEGDATQESQFGTTSSIMVEDISPPDAPIPDLPLLAMPDLPVSKSKFSIFGFLVISGLIMVILNLFGLFSSVFESLCDTDTCRGDEQTRINLLDFYKINESDGWSYSLLSSSMESLGGVSGGIGIPDLVAILGLLSILIYSRKKK